MPIYDAAMRYKAEGTPLVIIAGKEYGTGSSRDWAAKGTNLLGVRAVIAETYERIHRSNLVGMGVIPLQFLDTPPEFDGTETFTILGVGELTPRKEIGGHGHPRRRHQLHLPGPGPHRYRQRARIFQGRRHPPLRAAAPGAEGPRTDRDRADDRDRRLERRGPDPAGLSACCRCGRLTGQSMLYQGMNVVGAAGFAVNGWWHGALPSASLNVIWR